VFRILLCLSLLGVSGASERQWTVYLAQDKHLDYGWCGSTTEIELRMAALVDYYLDAAAQGQGRWNIDGTIWDEVYRRHRGPAGSARLRDAIRRGRIGYAGNCAVLLWGILDTETAIRACYGAASLEQATDILARTALVMENPAMTWGAASVLTECGFDFLGRGIYSLRARSYNHRRDPYPLFWWQAPNGKRLLVHWDLYQDTKSWGGYAEGFRLLELAGVRPDASRLQTRDVNNDADVFAKRKAYIDETIARYQAYGDAFPLSSILLLGTDHDGWICTQDLSQFVERYNTASDGRIRIVDARYQDFFEAAEREIREKNLDVPTLTGSFGICWEEWAAHLAGPTATFRQAQRLLRQAEAAYAAERMAGRADQSKARQLQHATRQLLKFAEHDFGGTDRPRAAISAGVRASTAAQAMDIARALAPKLTTRPAVPAHAFQPEETTFTWRGGQVVFDPQRCAVVSLTDGTAQSWLSPGQGPALGEFVPTRYRTRGRPDAVLPEPLAPAAPLVLGNLLTRRADHGVEILAAFERAGYQVESKWLFHSDHSWIDVTYRLQDGWTDDPQTVEFSFPFALDNPTYRYDAPGAILRAGPISAGGDDLPGANPELYAGLTFAAADVGARTALVLGPDALLWRFGAASGARLTSMPMMNLTANDHQFGQGGWRDWTFRYRIVLHDGAFDPVRATSQAQLFATRPFIQTPGCPSSIPGLDSLAIDFTGGPLLAFKVAEDDRRLILRFWNVTDQTVKGSLKLSPAWPRAERCDALERSKQPLDVTNHRAHFTAAPRTVITLALLQDR